MKKNDIYNNSFIINYEEGDKSLQRQTILHEDDLEDRSYVIKDGDTLTGISNDHYGEPLFWYIIADVNNIYNPFILEVGKSIIIPNISKYENE